MMNGRMTTAAINERDETDTVDDDDLAGRRVTPITHHLQKRGRFVGNKHFGYFLLLFFLGGFPLLHSFLLSFVYSHRSRSVGFYLGNRWVWRGNVQLDQFPSFFACCINDYDLFARSGWRCCAAVGCCLNNLDRVFSPLVSFPWLGLSIKGCVLKSIA